MENSGYTQEFIDELLNFKGFDHIAEQESALINKLIKEEKQKSLNKKIRKVKAEVRKVKAEVRREDVDDLKQFDIYDEIDAAQTLTDILDEELHKALVKDKRDKLNKKINKVKNVNEITNVLLDDGLGDPIQYSKYTYAEDGQPCSINCERHRSHPCEKCGRIEAKGYVELPLSEIEEKRLKLRLKLWKINR